ncbi:MAG TPA: acetolactate synthase large subunit [Deltaproteobacteria bacterium]|nr:acetolactate synthase large subunit [Deltaproteobacteria bacterium]
MHTTDTVREAAAARSWKASDLFVRSLEEEGVRFVFGIAGEENLDFLESLRKSGKIRFVVTRHEQAAAFMAATCGRLTGRAGVVLSTLGPGAANLVTGVAYAQLGGMPLVVITGQKPIKKSKQGLFQIVNVIGMMSPLTKASHLVTSAAMVPSLVRRAFKLAEEERPGAVHLELPEDVASETTAGERVLARTVVRRPAPDPKAVDDAARLVERSRRPLILIAAAANRKLVRRQLSELIEGTGIPFFTTQMGKGVISEDSPLWLGTAALTEGDYLHCAIDRADLIISIGHDVTEKPPAIMGHGARKVIHINFYSAVVDDVYCPTIELVGDISHSIYALRRRLRVSPRWDFAYFRKIIDHMRLQIGERADDGSFPVKPQRLVADLRSVVPRDGIVTLDNGVYKIWMARNYPAYERNTVLLDNALATMGAGLPSAIAAKLVHPERAVVALCGDGGFMMNSQEMETAVRLGLDLTVLVVNDNGYGMVKWKQQAMGLENFGLDYTNPDFVRYAESYGARGHRVERTEDLAGILRECMGSGGVHLVECPVDYSENHRVLTEELRAKTCLV